MTLSMIFGRISGVVGFVFTNVYVAYIKLILKGHALDHATFTKNLANNLVMVAYL